MCRERDRMRIYCVCLYVSRLDASIILLFCISIGWHCRDGQVIADASVLSSSLVTPTAIALSFGFEYIYMHLH